MSIPSSFIAPSLQVVPSSDGIGADIIGLDLNAGVDGAQAARIHAAWLEHLVLRFRGNGGLSLDRLAEFSRLFGELDSAPIASVSMGRNHQRPRPDITVISNIVENGRSLGGLGSYEAAWHADMTYNVRPPKGSALYAVEVPPSGGNTHFANMYAAYESLPAELKSLALTLECIHDASRNSAGELRVGFEDNIDPRRTVGARHPVVRKHPETGRRSLFLGRRRNAYLPGLPVDESEEILDRLWAHATQHAPVWTQVWQVGDVVLWDNRCTMHRRDAFDPATRRLMYRTQISGEAVQ
ncbi:TauD/TfdA family dioxygenase [Cupriavidus sp. AU9028]|uniref:TauD/TfdA dioxygenase family protein n=1 Tax=Cupriavidus sp. AU9028 TaxID=2871157 RepID=UPI001C96DE67|nr:TauD/TfdA family dioxygenase [Cupriavidus sp. AU9028]MBY4897133.1 TauD/TfdA family dioxygenase [Cupriavidus sp. AU9028]